MVIDGGRIVMTVLWIRGDKVGVGFDASEDIVIHRGEVQERIERQRGGGR